MKQWKKIIIFASVLVVLIGILVVTSLYNKKGNEDVDPTPTPGLDPIVDVKEADVDEIIVENSNGTFKIKGATKPSETSDEEEIFWILENPKDILFDSSIIKSRVRNYINITPSQEVTTDTTELKQYGLLEPTAKVTLKLKSGEKITILFGNETLDENEIYVMVDGSSRISTTSNYVAQSSMISVLDILKKDIYGGKTLADFVEMTFSRKKDSVQIHAFSNLDGDEESQAPSTWKLTKPLDIETNLENFNSFITELTSITPSEYKEMHPQDLSLYGLDAPDYEFTLKDGKSETKVLLGGNAGEGKIYGFTSYIDSVFVFDFSSLSFIDKPLPELVNSFVYMISIWEVSNIDIKIDSTVINCEIDDEQNSDKESNFIVNGKNANVVDSSDSSYFRSFYQSIISVFVKGIEVDAKPEYKEEISIKYTLKEDGTVVNFGFTKRDEYTYYCFKDGEYTGFYVDSDKFYSEKSSTKGILPEFKVLENAINNQTDGVYQ